jgi:hypothetical protein
MQIRDRTNAMIMYRIKKTGISETPVLGNGDRDIGRVDDIGKD